MAVGIQKVLPAKLASYAKFFVALLTAVVTGVIAVTSAPEWLTIVSSVLGSVGVFLQTNATDEVDGSEL